MHLRAIAAFFVPLVVASCSPRHDYDNPPDLPRAVPSQKPRGPGVGPGAAQALPEPYFETESSDAWVAHNFKLQPRYARVLLVGEPKVARIDVAPPSLGAASAGATAHDVDASFSTLQEAIDASRPGDLVAVQPGRYAGFVLGGAAGAKDGAYTFIRALGPPGSVVIDRVGANRHWMIYLQAAHHVVIEGFHLEGAGDGSWPRAGLMLDGDFGRTGRFVRNVAIVGVLATGHRMWGLHATDTATVLLQDSVFAGSVIEHGAYVSDGSDDWVIRRNVFANNFASGLQINLDPLASLEETTKHFGMTGLRPMDESRAWAQETLARAVKEYGEHQFPDGRGVNFIVEDNVAVNNGDKGGAAFNFAAICESLIQNNLAYANVAGGLALWDNHNPFDLELTDAQPSSPADWVADKKPLFGSRDNVVRYNTFMNQPSPRAAIQIRHGSWGNHLIGNIAVHGRGPGLWITADSLESFEARGNVMGLIELDDAARGMLKVATLMPSEGSRVDVPYLEVAQSLVAPTAAPWVTIEGGWWRPAPRRPDFRPRPGASLLTVPAAKAGVAAPGLAPGLVVDLAGKKRERDVAGAFAP